MQQRLLDAVFLGLPQQVGTQTLRCKTLPPAVCASHLGCGKVKSKHAEIFHKTPSRKAEIVKAEIFDFIQQAGRWRVAHLGDQRKRHTLLSICAEMFASADPLRRVDAGVAGKQVADDASDACICACLCAEEFHGHQSRCNGSVRGSCKYSYKSH